MSSLSHGQQNNDDYQAATRVFDTNSLFQCPLCRKNFQDPRILCSNGHTFCLYCVQHVLPDDGILKCPICKESRHFDSVNDMEQLQKNYTLQTLKRAEHHRMAPLGICELCNKKSAYGRCFHCRSLACFKCMNEHEQNIVHEQTKEYTDLVKIRDKLNENISQWDKKLIESKHNIRTAIQADKEKQIKKIEDLEQALYAQLDDLCQNYSTAKNIKLQNIKIDVEKESKTLDQIDPKNWSISDRIHSSQYWLNLQRNFDEQSIDFIYKSTSLSPVNHSYLGEIHLKPSNQENQSLQQYKSSTFDDHLRLIPCDQFVGRQHIIKTKKDSKALFNQSPKIHRKNENNNQAKQGENNEFTTRRMFRTGNRQQHISNEADQQLEDNTPLTPRMPIAPIHLEDYSKKATQILTGPNEADKFLAPKAIAMTDTNQLIIADTKKHRIIIYDLNLKTMRGIKGFLFPDGLCLAKEQYIIITDRHRISKYDWFYGKMVSFIGSKNEGCTRSSFSWPKGVAIDNNYVYVCDSYNSRMIALTHQMRYENEWLVMRGTKKLDPQYISISTGLLFVTAWQRIKPESCAYNAGCIIVYSTDGSAQRCIDTDIQSCLNLSIPEGIVCDSANQLILADRHTSKILSMNNDNQQSVIHFHGDKMKAPHYVCFSSDQNTMIVSDIGNNTVQFYEKQSQ
ncbi:unnamed protein product [Rotaria socialis]|uniref:RING-type domain-containing protein n=1 Tax=Rotaria socialis TaxID=392032 RepID=A0A817NQ55_9BILA|nr:unnamed protein product [Rotaria socialis]CAF4167275.1 unnamed protein product [Rotaria socialis]